MLTSSTTDGAIFSLVCPLGPGQTVEPLAAPVARSSWLRISEEHSEHRRGKRTQKSSGVLRRAGGGSRRRFEPHWPAETGGCCCRQDHASSRKVFVMANFS